MIYYQHLKTKKKKFRSNRELFEEEIFVGPKDKDVINIEVRDFTHVELNKEEYSSDDEEDSSYFEEEHTYFQGDQSI